MRTYVCTCVHTLRHALGMSLVMLIFLGVTFRNIVFYSNFRKYDGHLCICDWGLYVGSHGDSNSDTFRCGKCAEALMRMRIPRNLRINSSFVPC